MLSAVLMMWQLAASQIGEPASFQDCPHCPEMVVVPAGEFRQGDLQGDGDADELPVRTVQFERPYALARREVSNELWAECVSANACQALPTADDAELVPEAPVQNVSWNDAQDFVVWLSTLSGQSYRLPTESEFEYAARAGTASRFPWGDAANRAFANYGTEDCCGGALDGEDRWLGTAPSGAFPANPFGLFDLAGNVQEWTADCWADSYVDAPKDGTAREGRDCERRVLRGGSWSSTPKMIRPANRDKGFVHVRLPYYGFRVARNL